MTVKNTQNVLWFKEIKKEDLPYVGGKGANLGEMSSHFPVPDGFCVTVAAYKNFLDATKKGEEIFSLLDKTECQDTEKLDAASKKIRDMILKEKFPDALGKEITQAYKKLQNKKVAVRSSATAEDLPTASFAGQQDTYLNIEGEKTVIGSVQKCWASLFTSRAIYYREQNKFKHKDVLISVVVQEMINPAYAGVMFTIDPIHKKFLLIEVVEGLGEKLVSGETTPNTYFLDRKTDAVTEEHENLVFDKKKLKEIAAMGKKIEAHYKKPQDIEFAFDKKGKLYILQARPITTL